MTGFFLPRRPQGASLAQRGGPASTGRADVGEPRERGARLSPERERELVVATEGGDEGACRQLVDSFLPAIGSVARRFGAGGGVQRAELMQEGIVGLLYAAQRYDPRMETPFWGYASFWVRKAMQELVAEVTRPMALSDHAVRGLARVKAARRDLLEASGAEPTEEELAAATGFTRSQLDSLMAIDLVTDRLPPRLRSWLTMLNYALITAFLVYLISFGVYLSWVSRIRSFQGMPGVSYSLVTMSLPVGAFLLLITTIGKVQGELRGGSAANRAVDVL